jgi:Carboxypeptidase regulatory-like domain
MVSRRSLLLACLGLAVPGASLLAQTGYVVQGRIVQEGSGDGIPNVIVQLEGFGYSLTNADGRYQFQGVPPGGYELEVMTLGYAPESRFVPIEDAGAVVDLQLRRAPIVLDTLRVSLRSMDLRGRVREANGGPAIVDAQILSNVGRDARTDPNGGFELDDVYADVPLSVRVRAFGYLPLDYDFVPSETESYTFELQPDPVMQAMINEAVAEIEDRAGGWRSGMLGPMNREDILKFKDGTVGDLIRMRYGRTLSVERIRVACVVIDERQTLYTGQDMARLVPQEIQRIEYLRSPTSPKLVSLRIYTRNFMRDMVAGGATLHQPFFTPPVGAITIGATHRDPLDYAPVDGGPGRAPTFDPAPAGTWMCG